MPLRQVVSTTFPGLSSAQMLTDAPNMMVIQTQEATAVKIIHRRITRVNGDGY